MRAFWERLVIVFDDKLWLRPALASLISIALVGFAWTVEQKAWIASLPVDLSEDALKNLLSIFASSMLAVATFSVSAIVMAVSAVSSTTTPRAERLVLADKTAQTVLASFITAFIYSIIALLAIEVVGFEKAGRLVLFAGLVVIVTWVLVSFLAWVNHVTTLGRVSSTMKRIETYALSSAEPVVAGSLGGRSYDGDPPTGSVAIAGDKVGYVTMVDVQRLHGLGEAFGRDLYLVVRPGDFVHARQVLVQCAPGDRLDDDQIAKVRAAIHVGEQRELARDLRFGLTMLAETADRALSPGVNDPGTAVAILGVQLRVLTAWASHQTDGPRGRDEAEVAVCGRVRVPRLPAQTLVESAFQPIARDGAGIIEVALALQRTLAALAHLEHDELREAAQAMSRTALVYSQAGSMLEAEIAQVLEQSDRLAEIGSK